jgi:hypothetical protein
MASKATLFVVAYSIIFGLALLASTNQSVIVTDEVAYALMTDSLVADGTFEVWNGFNETFSLQQILPSMQLSTNGTYVKMFGIPAPLYPVIAYVPFKVWGVWGLVAVNVMSFSAIIIIVYFMAKLLLDERLSAVCAVAYSFMTNALPFTNYILPHLLSTALVGFLICSVLRLSRDLGRDPSVFFVPGFVGGLAVGVRFTNGLFLALMGVFLLMGGDRRRFYALLSGSLIPAIAIMLINISSFGSPFETGYNWAVVKPYHVVLMGLVLGSFWLMATGRVRHRGFPVGLAVLAAIATFFFWETVLKFFEAFYGRVFNMDLDPSGIKVYNKKALLQSSPFLILSAVSLAYIARDPNKRILGALAFAGVLNLAFYSTYSHGGADETISMRYFLESVPYLMVLSAYSFDRLIGKMRASELIAFAAVAAAILAAFLSNGDVVYSTKPAFRGMPAVLSLMLLATCIIRTRYGGHRALCIMLVAGCVGISCAYGYADWKVVRSTKSYANDIESGLVGAVQDNSAVFVFLPQDAVLFTQAKIAKNVRLHIGFYDNSVTPQLVEYYVGRGIPVYYFSFNNRSVDESWASVFGNASTPGGAVQKIEAYT